MRSQKNNYIIGTFFALSVLIANQIIIQYFLSQKHQESKTLNLAGRQRTLSQKINLQYLELLNGYTVNNNIYKTFNSWQQIHYTLIYGNKNLNIKGISNIKTVKILSKLTTKINVAGKIIHQKPTYKQLAILKQNQAQFLTIMDVVVNDLENDTNENLFFLISLEILLCMLSILIIVVEVFLIYKPIFREQKEAIKKVESSESKLKAILNSTTDSNILISPDFKIINFNNAAEQAVKQFFVKQITFDEDFKQYIVPGTEEIFYEEFNKCLSGEIVSSEYNFDPFGFDIWFCNTYYPVYNNLNKVIGVTFNSTNIDQRKKAEIKIEAQLTQLKEIAWEQSHILRSPLANILGLTKLMVDIESPRLNEETEIYVKLLHEVERLDLVITDIVKKSTNS